MPIINGTENSDIIAGTPDADTIDGLGGDDLINAGSGGDTVNGGAGNDIVHGDDGDDTLSSFQGRDSLYGDAGNDSIYVTLDGSAGVFLADGGFGNDIIQFNPFGTFRGDVTANGGDGNDFILLGQGANSTVNGGAGDDRIAIGSATTFTTVTLGTGRDVVSLGYTEFVPGRGTTIVGLGNLVVLNDYQPGTDQVSINWDAALFSGWTGANNPFAEGFVKLVQVGNDVILRRSINGNDAGFDQLRFLNTSISSLTAADLGGYHPNGTAAAGLVLTGSEGDDNIVTSPFGVSSGLLLGGVGADTIDGRGGNDQIFAGNGNDIIQGGSGNDFIVGGGGHDFIDGGVGDDNMNGGLGNDIYIVDSVGDFAFEGFNSGGNADEIRTTLSDYTLRTGSGIERLVFIGTGSAALRGNADANVLVGGAGNDLLDGGAGFDTAIYSNLFRSYTVSLNGSAGTVSGAGVGTDTLTSIETIQFKDGKFVFNADGVAAQVTRLYDTVLQRAPDQPGLDLWVDQIEDRGGALKDVANGFLNSAEFQAATGSLDNAQYVEFLYQNALGRASDPDGKANWIERLNNKSYDRADLLIGFSESQEHRNSTEALVSKGFFDTDDAYQTVALLYDSFAGRLPDASGLMHWAEALKSGAMTLSQVAAGFANSAEFQGLIAGKSHADLVELMYQNTLNRASDAAGKAGWVRALDAGLSDSDLLIGFSQSAEHFHLIGSHITNGIDFF